MKQIFKSLVLVAAAVATLTSCEKAPEVTPTPEEYTITVNANLPAPEGTKTYLGEKVGNTYPVLWSANDKIRFTQIPYTFATDTYTPNGSNSTKNITIDPEYIGTTNVSFEVSFDKVNEDVNFIDYVAIHGGSSYGTTNKRDDTYTYIQIIHPQLQIPAEGGQFDPSAVELVARSLGHTSAANALNLQFQHLLAYAQLTITNMNCAISEKIKNVTFTSGDYDIAGNHRWYYTDPATLHPTFIKHNSGTSRSITIDMSSLDVNNQEFVVPFSVFPTSFVDGNTITITVTTDADKTYTREITITNENEFAFAQGSITKLSANFSEATVIVNAQTKFELVKIANLQVGDEVILVANNEADYFAAGAVSTTSTKYLTKVDINAPVSDVITITDEAVDVFTLDKYNDHWRFESAINADKYVAWTSGNNATYGTSGTNIEWTISIAADGKATITNVKDDARILKYNVSSPRFAAYTSGQTTPSIYRKITNS